MKDPFSWIAKIQDLDIKTVVTIIAENAKRFVASHHETHELGGSDVVIPILHAPTHESGGTDVVAAGEIRTTSGPTDLVVEAIADGEFLKRVGATIVSSAGSIATPVKGCRVFHNANQTLTTGVVTTLAFNSELFDSDVMHDVSTNNSRITFKTSGIYQVGGNVEYASNNVGIRDLRLVLNGTTIISFVRVDTPDPANAAIININTTYEFAQNDYVELLVLQTSGGNLDIGSTARYAAEFWACRLTTDTGPQGSVGPAVFLTSEGEQGEQGFPGISGRDGIAGITGAQGATGPAIFLLGEEGEAGISGSQGLAGSSGSPGIAGQDGKSIFLAAESGEDGEPGIPGKDGIQGTQGSQGIQGEQGLIGPAIFLVGEEGEKGEIGSPGLNGIQGLNGSDGIQGSPGPAIFLIGESGEDGFNGPPGSKGETGAPGGGGGGSATTIEKDLGSTPKWSGRFTITDAAINTSSKILCWQAPGPYTGKGTRADEAEMQPVKIIAVSPASGTAIAYWETPHLTTYTSEPRMQNGALTSIPKDPQAVVGGFARRMGKVRGNVKFSYVVFA